MAIHKIVFAFILLVAACLRVVNAANFPTKRLFNEKGSSTRFGQDESQPFTILIGKAKRVPFQPPTMHPFESLDELNNVRQLDPYSFPSTQYSHSELNTRKLFSQLSDNNNNIRNMKKILVEGVDYVPYSEHENFVQDGSLHSYSFEANILSGVTFLDHENSVWDVTCGNSVSDGNTIQVDFSNGHLTARQWIPGTRLVIGKKWNCFGSNTNTQYGKEEQLAFLVLSRSITESEGEMLKITFQVKPLRSNELFINGRVSYHSVPMVRESESNFTSLYTNGNKKSKNERYSWTQRLYAIGFNYDINSGAVKQASLPIYSASSSYGDFKVVCENCYAYLNAEFRIEFEWTWTSITKAQAMVGGKFESEATFKASFSKSFSQSKNAILGTFPSMNFSFNVYGIPVWVEIIPKLGCSVDFNTNGLLEYSRNFKASYEQYIGYQYSSALGYIPVRQGSGFTWSSTSPGLRLEATASTEFSLYPEFDIKIWSLITTTVNIKPKFIVELGVTGLASSLSNYQVFASLESFYKVDVNIKNELFQYEKELNIYEKTAIPSLSGTYSLQSSSYKAVDSSNIYSTGNAIPTLSSASIVNAFTFQVKIQPSDKHYYLRYYSGSVVPTVYTGTTDSYNCKYGCVFTFTPAKYIAVRVDEDGYFYDTKIYEKTFDLTNHLTNTPSSEVTVDSSGIVSVVLVVTSRTVTFQDTPSNSLLINYDTKFVFEKKSYLDMNYIAFTSDRYISSIPFASLYENGQYYYYGYTVPSQFTIPSSGATIKFISTMAYRMVGYGTTLNLNGTTGVIRDEKRFNSFIQIVGYDTSNRYSVTIQSRGSFDILIYEGWMVTYSIYQTKGKQYKYIEPMTGNVDLLPLRTHHFNISLENTYGTSQQKTQLVIAQLIPIGGTILETIRFDPYIENTDSPTLSSTVLIEQKLTKNWNLLHLVNSIIPIPSTFKESFYISPDKTNRNTLSIGHIQNYKLVNGIPSIVKKLSPQESAYFALPCSNSTDFSSGYLRVIDSVSGKIVAIDEISATVQSDTVYVFARPEVVLLSGGAFSIAMETVNTFCKTDTSKRYVQIAIKSKDTSSRQLQLEFSQTVDFTKINSRSINAMTINPQSTGNVYIDISKEKNSFGLNGKKGLVFIVSTLDDCNIDLYINKKDQLASPSFYDSSSIYASSSSLSTKGERMSVSLISQHGSIIMMYSDTTCRFTLATEELKSTQLSINFIANNQPITSMTSLSINQTTLIHVKILDSNHAWDRNFTKSLQSDQSNIFSYFKTSNNFQLTNFYSSINFVVIDAQTLAFEFVPKTTTPISPTNTTISFQSEPIMFDSRYEIQSGNQLVVRSNDIIPPKSSSSTILGRNSTNGGSNNDKINHGSSNLNNPFLGYIGWLISLVLFIIV